MRLVAAKYLVEALYKWLGCAAAGFRFAFTGVAGKQPLCSILQCNFANFKHLTPQVYKRVRVHIGIGLMVLLSGNAYTSAMQEAKLVVLQDAAWRFRCCCACACLRYIEFHTQLHNPTSSVGNTGRQVDVVSSHLHADHCVSLLKSTRKICS